MAQGPGAVVAVAGPRRPPSTRYNPVEPVEEEEDLGVEEVAGACNSAEEQTGFCSSLKKRIGMDIKFNKRQT
jgi:hypothetical protein